MNRKRYDMVIYGIEAWELVNRGLDNIAHPLVVSPGQLYLEGGPAASEERDALERDRE